MRICFIVGAFPPMKCGIGDYTYNLCRELKNLGMDIDVITSSNSESVNEDGFNIHNIINEWTFESKNIIIKKLQELKIEVVHIQYPSEEYGESVFINLLPGIIKRKLGIKVVETVHEYLNYTYKGKLRNLINYKSADSIFVVEKQYIDKIKSFIPIISKSIDIKYIPISSNIPISNMDEYELQKLKENLGLKDEKVISYFGFINELKGFEILLESVQEIKKSINNIRLLILAELNKNNNYHQSIINKIEEYKMQDNIIITGFIDSSDKVADYLRLSDLAILPFKQGVSERNGSFLAAYNQGIPIITTCIEDKKSEDGIYYVNPGESIKIVEEAKKILSVKQVYRRQVLSWGKIAEIHAETYIRL